MKSIILNADEIRRLQSDGAVQKRVVMRPQPFVDNEHLYWIEKGAGPRTISEIIKYCPYQTGDRLYVKETWRCASCSGYEPINGDPKYTATIEYRSTYDHPLNGSRGGKTVEIGYMHYGGNLRRDGGVAWKPPATMPQWASRYTVVVESVTAEKDDAWKWVYELRFE